MSGFNQQKQWWIVIVVVVVVAVALNAAIAQWLPDYEMLGGFLLLGLIGLSFGWVYTVDKERLWWAIIPCLGMFTLLAAGLADLFIGPDPANDWVNVLVIGLGAALIAALLKRAEARSVLILVAMFSILVGFIMSPFTVALKGLLIAVDVLLAIYLLRQVRGPAFRMG